MTKIIIEHKAKIVEGKIIPSNINRFRNDLSNLENQEVSIKIEKWVKRRTDAQNRALHLYLTLLSTDLNLKGFDMRAIIRKDINIDWSPISAKEYLWRPIQKTLFQKKSTTKLTTQEINEIYDNLNRVIIERTGGEVQIPFPSVEVLFNEDL